VKKIYQIRKEPQFDYSEKLYFKKNNIFHWGLFNQELSGANCSSQNTLPVLDNWQTDCFTENTGADLYDYVLFLVIIKFMFYS
jgi:hypothetical protein